MNIGPRSFNKAERLKNRILIGDLFKKGTAKSFFPLRVFFLPSKSEDMVTTKFAVTVPKRNFPLAVDRNRIKRQLREACRLHKTILTDAIVQSDQYVVMFVYIGKKKLPYDTIEKNTIKGLQFIANYVEGGKLKVEN